MNTYKDEFERYTIKDLLKELIKMNTDETVDIEGSKIGGATMGYDLHRDFDGVTVDKYCYKCKKNKSFFISKEHEKNILYLLNEYKEKFMQSTMIRVSEMKVDKYSHIERSFSLVCRCPECDETIHMFYILKNNKITKHYEFPSEIKAKNMTYKKYNVLDSNFNYWGELSTANYLFYESKAYIGACIYLRRCLEHIILKIIDEKLKSQEISQEQLEEARHFDEKLKLIKSELEVDIYDTLHPTYSIMSKGIHDLCETECKEIFEILQITIISILDSEIYKIEKRKKLKEQREKVSKLSEKYNY